jgi:hypothetical protein
LRRSLASIAPALSRSFESECTIISSVGICHVARLGAVNQVTDADEEM